MIVKTYANAASLRPAALQADVHQGLHRVLTAAKPYLLIAPSAIVLAVFWLYPILETAGLSLVRWDFVSADRTFVGIANYVELLSDATFMQTLVNTVVYMVFTVSASVAVGMLVALYLQRACRRNAFLQAVVFSPYVVSLASIALLWLWILNKDFGLLNELLTMVGLPARDWLGDARLALPALIFISVWKSVGYDALILVSALRSIPDSLYEAAELDHASPLAKFRRITFPMISPTVFFLVIVEAISSLKVFETIQIMTQGGPQNSTNTLVFSLYQYAFQFYKVGYAAAMGMVLLVLLAVFAIVYFRLLEKRVHYR